MDKELTLKKLVVTFREGSTYDQLIEALASILKLDLPSEQRERSRPSWDEYFMLMAIAAATRSSCPRAKVGAILAKDRRPIGSGYSGAPPETPNCLEAGCKVIGGHCLRTVHGELNAVLYATRDAEGAVLYCTHKPCIHCTNDLIAAGISEIIYLIPYRAEDEESLFADEQLAQAGIRIRRLELRPLELSLEEDDGK